MTHGICDECLGRDSLGETPVLVVSRERAPAIPMLQALLRGAPEIAIVVDRRNADRRRSNGKGNGSGRPAGGDSDRRAEDRRKAPSFFLV